MADYSVTSESEDQRLQGARMFEKLRKAMPGKILQFFPGKVPRATVQPLIRMKVTLGDEVQYISMPPINDVRVQLPAAQTAGLLVTLPLKQGDTGMLIIPDKGTENFLRTGNESNPPFYGDPATSNPRSHSLEDAVFYPGYSADTFEIEEYSAENIEIRDRERKNYISLGSDGIEISDGLAVWSMSGGKVKTVAPAGNYVDSPNMQVRENDTSKFSGEMQADVVKDKDGVVLGSHTHSGVQTGGGNTGGPNK